MNDAKTSMCEIPLNRMKGILEGRIYNPDGNFYMSSAELERHRKALHDLDWDRLTDAFFQYGPQTLEVKVLLNKVMDPGNDDAIDALISSPLLTTLYPYAYELGEEIWDALTAVDPDVDDNPRYAYVDCPSKLLRWSLDALSVRHLVGEVFTPEMYDRMFAPAKAFLGIVDNTEPGSDERAIVCSAVDNGIEPMEALQTARGALLLA